MKHDAKWFFNFFNSKSNWCTGARSENGAYCAIGHLQKMEGYTDEHLRGSELTTGTALVMEFANVVFKRIVGDIWRTNDIGPNPKYNILKACRIAIRGEDPDCQLGKEYDT